MRASGVYHEPPGCLSPEALRAYASGELASGTVEAVASHISTCESCAASLEALPQEDSPLGAALRDCVRVGAPEPYGDQPTAEVAPDHAATTTVCDVEPEGPPDAAGRRRLKRRSGPAVIGKYRVLGRVGVGGMGVVHRAIDDRLNRVVAVKTLPENLSALAEARVRFLREGEAAARLDHPNIVGVFESGEYDGRPYLVMEYVAGGTLADRLASGPMPEEDAAALVEKVARGVQYAHDRGVLHRDLKPANVLLGEDGTPKVGDFGLARLLDRDAQRTLTITVVGTPSYMAPEQAAGRLEDIGPTTDVYGLGAILYEAMTGRPPFDGAKDEVLRQVATADFPAPSRYRADVSRCLEAVCLRCLEKRPADRYASAGELADDLARWQCGEPTRARPRGWLRRRVQAARRRPVCTGLLSVFALCAAVALPFADRMDPDRELKRIERDLADGKLVELIGAAGSPAWWQPAFPGGPRPDPVARDQPFVVQTWDLAMVELVRDPRCERFRLIAEVRHLDSKDNGEVGVYLARRSYPANPAPLQQYLNVSFNDVKDPWGPIGGPARNSNLVRLAPRFVVPAADKAAWDCEWPGPVPLPFRPAGRFNTGWRKIRVDVTPERVDAFWDGADKPSLQLRWDGLADTTQRFARRVLVDRPDHPFAPLIDPVFPVRGGIGLLVLRGSAAFRSVTLGVLKGE